MVVPKSLEPDYLLKFRECDEKFETVFNLTSIASKIIGPDLTILKVNPAMETLLGYSAVEIVGSKILDYACPEYKQHWHDLQEALWQRETPFFKLDACLIKKDKSLAWVSVTTVLFREDGNTYGYTVLDDFTYKKNFEESERQLNESLKQSRQTQESLRLNEQRLTQILETMAEGVGIIDKNGNSTYANPMARKILGISEHVDITKHFSDPGWKNLRIDGTDLPQEEHPMDIVLKSGKPIFDAEISIQPQNGERFYISINAAPLFGDDGNITGAIGTFMDVSNRRKIASIKDEFISIASHELRTPVTSLKAALQLLSRLKDTTANPMVPKLVNQANRSLDKLGVLIEDLLNTSRMNAGQLHLNKKEFNVAEVIEDCCYEIRMAGEYHLYTVGDADINVVADASRVDQVLTNFINNAIKYAPLSKDIIVRVEHQKNFVKISVEDDGPGISPEKLPHLFNRYYRVDDSGNQYSGLGLGLYISSEIIKRHNGEIGVDSRPGFGSKFWFTLPFVPENIN